MCVCLFPRWCSVRQTEPTSLVSTATWRMLRCARRSWASILSPASQSNRRTQVVTMATRPRPQVGEQWSRPAACLTASAAHYTLAPDWSDPGNTFFINQFLSDFTSSLPLILTHHFYQQLHQSRLHQHTIRFKAQVQQNSSMFEHTDTKQPQQHKMTTTTQNDHSNTKRPQQHKTTTTTTKTWKIQRDEGWDVTNVRYASAEWFLQYFRWRAVGLSVCVDETVCVFVWQIALLTWRTTGRTMTTASPLNRKEVMMRSNIRWASTHLSHRSAGTITMDQFVITYELENTWW